MAMQQKIPLLTWESIPPSADPAREAEAERNFLYNISRADLV